MLSFQCCTLLVKQLQANVNAVNTSRQTALMLAVIHDSEDVVKSLLK